MNNFWFTWANLSGQFHIWDFLDGGNHFELAPKSKRVEENQYDVGDRVNILISNKIRATLILTGGGWILDAPPDCFKLAQDPVKKSVQLTCIAKLVEA